MLEYDANRRSITDKSSMIVTLNPTRDEVETAVRRIDGRFFREFTLAGIIPSRETRHYPFLKIERWYETGWCTCVSSEKTVYAVHYLFNKDNVGMPSQVAQINGSAEILPATACNKLDDVVTVAINFAEHGLFDTRYQWRSSEHLVM